MAQQKETERVREIFEASAAHYDRVIAFSEKLLFGDGRAWAQYISNKVMMEWL